MRKFLKWSAGKIFFVIIVTASLFVFSSNSSCSDFDHKGVVKLLKAIEQKYHSATSFVADFIQQIYPPYSSSPSSEATGRFIFSKPCLMRWEYTSPDEQIIITYPSIGWLYAVKDKDVQVFDTTEFYKSMVAKAFLKDILDSFEIAGSTVMSSESSSSENGVISILLKPKGNTAQIAHVELVIQKQDLLITKIIGEDLAGTKNVLIFTKQNWNSPLSTAELFTPSFPKDVAISNDKGETLSYDAFMKQFQEKKGVLNCTHDSSGKK